MLPYDLYGKTVLIVGFGRIGTRTAKRCLAMEMNVLVYDPYKPASEITAAGCEAGRRSRRGAAACGFRHHPLPEDAGTGGHVQRGALRPDEADRLSHQHRPRRHRRRDVRCTTRWCRASSPAPASTCSRQSRRRSASRCSRLPNVIMAPHVAGVTVEAVDRMSEQTARNILSVLDGEPLRQNVINQDVLG